MNKIKTCLKVAVLCITSTYVHAQCEVFKSEISDVQHYMQQVSQLSDSLSTSAEIAAFDASFTAASASGRVGNNFSSPP